MKRTSRPQRAIVRGMISGPETEAAHLRAEAVVLGNTNVALVADVSRKVGEGEQ